MPDVLCAVVIDHLEFLRSRGVDLPSFIRAFFAAAGFPPQTPADYLWDPQRRLAWRDFATFLELWSERAGGRQAEGEFIDFVLRSNPAWAQRARRVVSRLISPVQSLALAYPTLQASLYRNLKINAAAPEGGLELHLQQRPGDRTCPVFYRLIGLYLKRSTHIAGYPEALLISKVSGEKGHYKMIPPPHLPWLARAWRWVVATLWPEALRRDLAQREAALGRRYEQLAAKQAVTQRDLDERLQALTAENLSLQTQIELLRSDEYAAEQRQEHEQALIRAKESAEQASRTKTAFLSSMSHEIRTPMTSVLGFAELLSHDEVPSDKRQNYVEKILRNSRHLLALIDNILDLAKIEGGHLVPHCLRFVPAVELLQDVDLLRDQAERKGLTLTLDCIEPFPQWMISDQVRLRQILLNLIGNAVKFTDQGGVAVTARLSPGSGPEMLEIHVRDTGLGIDPALQAHLFQPFSQVNIHGTRARPGTGLGLALARNIARSLGGDVILTTSTPGSGCTFTVMLPLDLPAMPKTRHD